MENQKRKKIRVGHTLLEEDVKRLNKETFDLKLDNRSQLFTIMIDFYFENKDK